MTPTHKLALLEKYNRLIDTERYMLEFVALCDQGIKKAELIRELLALLPRLSNIGVLRQKDLTPAYKNLRDNQLVLADSWGITLSAEIIYERTIRDAVRSGRYAVYMGSSFAGGNRRSWYGYYQNRIHQREFRAALYTGDKHRMFSTYKLLLDDVDRDKYSLELLPLTTILTTCDDLSWFKDCPPIFLALHLPAALTETQLVHTQILSFIEPIRVLLEDFSPVRDTDDEMVWDALRELKLLFVGECWLSGRMKEAVSVITDMSGYHRTAARAVAAFSKNEIEKSVTLFEEALKQMRKTKRRKRLFFNNVIGQIFIFACLRLDTPQALIRLKELLEDTGSRTNNSPWQEVFQEFKKLVNARLSPDDDITLEIYSPWGDTSLQMERSCTSILVNALYSPALFHEATRAIELTTKFHNQFRGSPHVQTTRNVQALLEHITEASVDHSAATTDRNQVSPTFDFSHNSEDWKLVLYNLSRIGQKTEPKKKSPQETTSRLSFRLSWSDWQDHWRVQAYIQKSTRKGGWTNGKLFSPKKRLDTKIDTSFFTKTDERVLMILESERDHAYHGIYEENHNEAIYKLAGHPYLFWDGPTLAPVEIETASPQVEVVEIDDQVEIRMHPSDPCDKGFHVEKRNGNQIRVTRFSPIQLELLHALGQNGARFPISAKADIAETITHLGTLTEVHSHVPNIGKQSIDVPSSQELLIRMQPFLNGLSAQFLVTPLGPGGPTFVPGHGSVHVFATVENEKCTTSRHLKAEFKQLDDLLMALGLYHTEEAGDGLYQFPEEGEAIAFLSELENCKARPDAPPFSVEWPQGVKLRCTRTLFPKDFHLLVNKKRKWLSVSGSLKINDNEVFRIAELLSASERPEQGFIRLKDGQFLRLSKSLRKFLSHLRSMGEAQDDGTIKAPENAAINVMKLAEEAGELKANQSWDKTVENLDRTLSLESKVPTQVKATLREYQKEGYRWLHRLSSLGFGACLADDMGLGKTLQTLALIQHRFHAGVTKKPTLVVAPVSVIPGWFSESRRFVPGLTLIHYAGPKRKQILNGLKPKQVLVTSYGLLQRDGAKLAKIEFDMIVLDEAQFIKNRDSARAKAAFKLQGDFRMVTTGTPVENRLSEFWSVFHFINPGLLGSHKVFQDTYEKSVQLFDDTRALDALRWQVKPFLLRRTKEETLDELPAKTEIVRYCEMSKEEAAFYELKRRQAQNILSLSDSKHQLMALITALTALRQAACHPKLIEPDTNLDSAKLACLKDILTELKEGGHQALIFSQFVKFLSIVKGWLDEQGITYQYMDGSCTAKQRTAAVDAFQAGESDLFLISTRAGGFGLNLTAADYVVHLDPWWNPAVEDQASDRIHRIGQTRPVTIYKLVTKGTVEEKVLQIHGEKRELASGLLEGSNAVAKLNMKELIKLI